MEENIQNLYKCLADISASYLIYQDRHNIEMVKDIIAQIQEFVLWFLESNRCDIEQELYLDMCNNLVDILKDILTALEQEDRVLMHDAVAYGIMEYLTLFVKITEEESDE